jgi:hypothetical protein
MCRKSINAAMLSVEKMDATRATPWGGGGVCILGQFIELALSYSVLDSLSQRASSAWSWLIYQDQCRLEPLDARRLFKQTGPAGPG